jgi:hypothetical protein
MKLEKQEAINFFAALFYGEHHIPSELKEAGDGWQISSNYTTLASFDFNGLTRLVLLAHDRCMRVDVSARGMNRIVIMVHKRVREGDMTKRHPTMEEHIETIRTSRDYNLGL